MRSPNDVIRVLQLARMAGARHAPGMVARAYSIREFEAFRALIATGTATAAARRIGVSQSAVSRAVANLEARLGTLLFERSGARLAPTADAVAFNATLDAFFDALGRLDRSRWVAPPPETLRLVAPATLGHTLLPRRIASFLKLHPDQPVSLEIIASDALVSGIAEDRFDLGITDFDVSHSGVRVEAFRETEAVCVLPAGHPLADRAAIGPTDLSGVPFIALTRRHSVRSVIDRLFAEAGIVPRVVVDTATSASAFELVRLGVGITIMNPFPVAFGVQDGVALRPFVPRILHRTQFLTPATRPSGGPVRAFIKHLRATTPKPVQAQ